jgi:hypothetical protein
MLRPAPTGRYAASGTRAACACGRPYWASCPSTKARQSSKPERAGQRYSADIFSQRSTTASEDAGHSLPIEQRDIFGKPVERTDIATVYRLRPTSTVQTPASNGHVPSFGHSTRCPRFKCHRSAVDIEIRDLSPVQQHGGTTAPGRWASEPFPRCARNAVSPARRIPFAPAARQRARTTPSPAPRPFERRGGGGTRRAEQWRR